MYAAHKCHVPTKISIGPALVPQQLPLQVEEWMPSGSNLPHSKTRSMHCHHIAYIAVTQHNGVQ
jgi:hypothetical protein